LNPVVVTADEIASAPAVNESKAPFDAVRFEHDGTGGNIFVGVTQAKVH
jgi:hypothetical protein